MYKVRCLAFCRFLALVLNTAICRPARREWNECWHNLLQQCNIYHIHLQGLSKSIILLHNHSLLAWLQWVYSYLKRFLNDIFLHAQLHNAVYNHTYSTGYIYKQIHHYIQPNIPVQVLWWRRINAAHWGHCQHSQAASPGDDTDCWHIFGSVLVQEKSAPSIVYPVDTLNSEKKRMC